LHNCAAPGCNATIRRVWLMCRPHWSRVPAVLQRAVYAGWRHGAGVTSSEYREAVKAAVTSLADADRVARDRADLATLEVDMRYDRGEA
jgi:hypothetical protein